MRTQTIIELLDITPEEQAQLQVLISPEVRRARHREKERERTRRTGKVRQDRQTYLATHRDNAERPWETLGISRSTWYRKGKPRLGESE